MKVIGTAGHIDHGKSTLVKRLTGIDPDRLEEEKRRGMTIDLGFAWLNLPSGDRASIVDVPGHERFVHTMLAGVGGIDLALLVVAADESVMPQTREHVAILDLLGVRGGVVALTKADGVEDGLVELVTDDIRCLLRGTTLEGSPIVPVDALSGRGVGRLLAVLESALAGTPDRASDGAPYLPVDRVFTQPGFGTIVTGTLHGGALAVGDEVEILPEGRAARVRGLQIHSRQAESAPAGARVAANLSGVTTREVRRGSAVVRDRALRSVRHFDARVRVLEESPVALRSGMEVTVHVAAAEQTATVRCLEGEILPGEESWVRIDVKRPVAARRRQRIVLRLPSPVGTVAGGEIVDLSPRRGPRRDVVARLQKMGSSDATDVVAAVLGDRVHATAEIAAAAGESEARIRGALEALERSGDVIEFEDAWMTAVSWETLSRRVASELMAFHEQHPLRSGMPAEELRRRAGAPAETWRAILTEMERVGMIARRDSIVALPDYAPPEDVLRERTDRLLAELGREPFRPPEASELLRRGAGDRELLGALAREGRVLKVEEDLYFTRQAYETMVQRIQEMLVAEGSVSVAQVRDEFETSRKYALALLEHLDRLRLTQRRGDVRVAGSRAV